VIRIKYAKQKDGSLRTGIITSKKGIDYYATVCYTLGEGKVYNAKRRNVIFVCNSTNRNVLRRMVRRKLIELGVLLEKEFSEKGYAKTPKRKD
jgi:hypothetical protein